MTETLLTRLQPLVDGEKSRIFRARLEPLARELDSASDAFLTSLSNVQRVITIFDPTLGTMLSNVRQSQGGLLTGISLSGFLRDEMGFRIRMTGRLEIDYTTPSVEAMGADFEATYRAEISSPASSN